MPEILDDLPTGDPVPALTRPAARLPGLLRPHRFLLAAGLLFGGAFAVLTPPFQAPDEPAHFARAYRVSEGHLDLIPRPGRTRERLPESIRRLTTELAADLPFHAERKIAPGTIRAAFALPLAPDRRALVFFPNGLQYTFLPYVPQALGIAAGRLCGAPPLALLYLARLMNLVCGLLAVAFAVRRLPAFAWLAALVALTPMALFLFGSASGDPTTIAASFLLVSSVARLAWGTEGEARWGDLALLTASSMVLCASKPPYLPLALLAGIVPAARFPAGRRVRFLLAHGISSLAMAAWAIFSSRSVGTIRINAGVDSGRQIHDALLHPVRFLMMVAADYAVQAPRYLAELVGQLGWLDTNLPKPFLSVYLAVLLALVFLDTGGRIDVRPWQRGLAAAATLAAMTLVSASQYAIWTAYGEDFIEGIQGRYYIPLVLVAAWALHGRRWAGRIPPLRLGAFLAAFSLLSFGIAMRTLVRRYYGF
jgi:uncharacterized membrane protein